MSAGRVALAALLLTSAGCGPAHETFAQKGEALANDPTISGSSYNHMSCRTCHADRAANVGARIYPGAPLAGSVNRPTWWGGQVVDLEGAVNECFTHFMRGASLAPADDTSQALLAYLTDLSSTATAAENAAQPFHVVQTIVDVPVTDPNNQGAALYINACAPCHGAAHTGDGRIGPEASVLPEDPNLEHATYSQPCQREIFVEKVRHGSFLGYAGNMPPFSSDVLTDAQLGAILSYLGVYALEPNPPTCL